MKQWQQLPADLQLSDEAIKALSLKQTEELFATAERACVLEDFAQLFWDAVARINATKPSLQECVYLLEERKRQYGRRYANLKEPDYKKPWLYNYQRKRLATKYNELEYQIQWLVRQYGLKRTSKEYFLEVK